MFIGWGTEPNFSEFSQDGRLLVDGRLPAGNESYRAAYAGVAALGADGTELGRSAVTTVR